MRRILSLMLAVMLLASCVKNTFPHVPPVDENFDWKTTEVITVSIPLPTSGAVKSGEKEYATTAKIYTSPLYSASSLIASGAIYNGKPFETDMNLPKGLEQLFIKLVSPRGLVTLMSYDIVGSKAVRSGTQDLSVKAATKEAELTLPKCPVMTNPITLSTATAIEKEVPIAGRHYHIPANVSLSANGCKALTEQNLTVAPVVFVEGNITLTGDIGFTGTLVILRGGSVTCTGGDSWNKMPSNNALALYVQKGGMATFTKGLSAMPGGAVINFVNEGEVSISMILQTRIQFQTTLFYNTGKIEFNACGPSFMTNSTFYNTGELSATSFSLMNNSHFKNYNAGEVEIDGNTGQFSANGQGCSIYQHGFMEVKKLSINGCKVDNYGKLECTTLTGGNENNKNTFRSYAGSLLKVAKLERMQHSKFTVDPDAIIYIYNNGNGNTDNKNLQFVNESINGKDYGLILWGVAEEGKKEDNPIINPTDNVSFTGNIENYAPKKPEAQNLKYTEDYCTNNAFWGKRKHNIPESDYNENLGDGGEKEPVDKDKDGVPEGEDIDDNDPDVSHVSYFPSEGGRASSIFEDMWPYIGDYDMNDVVLDFRLAYYTKGAPTDSNPVVYMDIDWKLRAVGSQMPIACGMVLDEMIPSMATITTNNNNLASGPIDQNANGFESGQTKAVFALFNNPSEVFKGSMGINVFRDQARQVPVEKKVRIRFQNPIAKRSILVDKINPFIVVSSENIPTERGREVHLSTSQATDKINTRYYNEGFVSKNNPFKATNGMVWGYMVPVSFRYPVEMVSITKAYPNFVKWYQSAGAEYTNWYDTSISGNVVEEYLYESQATEE